MAPDWTRSPPHEVARRLIGATLTFAGVGGLVVETEAYDQDDPASHSFSGPTPRNAPMFGSPGCAYVYRSYGLHWCLNLVCGPRPGGAVLFRAIEPQHGLDLMAERRGVSEPRKLCAGPGRLCQALGITMAENGTSMFAAPFHVELADPPGKIAYGPRIGIGRAKEQPWRFGLAGSPFLSRPFPITVDAPSP